jgi:general secretion pathway protein I
LNRGGCQRQGGFTLLEILVAFIVLAVVGGSLLQLFQGGMRNVAYSAEYSRAALLARSRLAELEAYPGLLPGEDEGAFDEHYRWRLVVTPYEDPLGEAGGVTGIELVHAELSILWDEADTARQFTVDTLLLSTTPPEPEG